MHLHSGLVQQHGIHLHMLSDAMCTTGKQGSGCRLIKLVLPQAKELSKLVTVPKRMLPARMLLFKQMLRWASDLPSAVTATVTASPRPTHPKYVHSKKQALAICAFTGCHLSAHQLAGPSQSFKALLGRRQCHFCSFRTTGDMHNFCWTASCAAAASCGLCPACSCHAESVSCTIRIHYDAPLLIHASSAGLQPTQQCRHRSSTSARPATTQEEQHREAKGSNPSGQTHRRRSDGSCRASGR